MGGGVDGETKAGGEADAAEHAELIFCEAQPRGADGAEDAGGKIGLTAYQIEDGGGGEGDGVVGVVFKGDGIEEHAVDGEVAALDVVSGVGGEADAVGAAAVGVGSVMAEGGDLGWGLAFYFAHDEDDAEVGTYLEGTGEESGDLRGGGAGGDVEIFRSEVEEEIANAAAGEECLMTRCTQGCGDGACGGEGRAWAQPVGHASSLWDGADEEAR